MTIAIAVGRFIEAVAWPRCRVTGSSALTETDAPGTPSAKYSPVALVVGGDGAVDRELHARHRVEQRVADDAANDAAADGGGHGGALHALDQRADGRAAAAHARRLRSAASSRRPRTARSA